MIPQLALLLWIVISAGLFAVCRPVRAFLLTYVIGYLFLPVEIGYDTYFAGSIYITQSLRIDKLAACHIGALLGTALFASHYFRRFRYHWVDLAGVFILLGIFLTSIVNGVGPKDGLSHVIETLRLYGPLIFLARIYLTGPAELLEALHAILGGAFVYAFLCVAEWRLSPQTHRLVYGYFQHSFDQFGRYGHFRPVGFLRHAIEVAFLMGTSSALAAWLWAKGLLRPLWGVVPQWAVLLALLVGAAATMTFSGYAAFAMCAGALVMATLFRTRWVLILLPCVAIVWMAGRYSGAIDESFLMRVATSIDPVRAESLQYRLESEQLHLKSAHGDMVFGKSAINGIVRNDEGYGVKAVDAWWMITLVFYGLVGLAGWYLFWSAGIIDTIRHWRQLDKHLQAMAVAICILLGAQFIDFLFNAFPSPFLMLSTMGLIAVLQRRPGAIRQEMLQALYLADLAAQEEQDALDLPAPFGGAPA